MTRATTSWTEISTWRQCPHRWQLSYLDRWRSDHASPALAKGIYWHEIQDLHYGGIMADGAPKVEAIKQLLVDRGVNDPEHPQHEYSALMLWMYMGYRNHYKGLDNEWRIKAVEEEYEVNLPGTDVKLVLRIDLMAEKLQFGRPKGLWVWDHKAMSDLPHQKELDLDDQTALYVYACRQLGYPVVGALLNVSRTKRLKRVMTADERFHRYWLHKSDAEIATVVREAVETIEMMDEARHYPRHTDPGQCKWKCPFVDGCLAGRRDPRLEVDLLRMRGFRNAEDRGKEKREPGAARQLKLVT